MKITTRLSRKQLAKLGFAHGLAGLTQAQTNRWYLMGYKQGKNLKKQLDDVDKEFSNKKKD